MKKRILFLVVAFVMIFSVCACGKDNDKMSGTVKAEITVKDKGVIKLELDADEAPITVENFVNLVKDGFYDGLTFHRVANNFMIQGGDPKGDGTGGSDKTIKGEFSANGVKNNISHKRGVISMARNSISMDSASSQFFIVQADSEALDGQYAAFGHVTEGMDIVDDIAKNTPIEDAESGYVNVKNQPVIESIKIVE